MPQIRASVIPGFADGAMSLTLQPKGLWDLEHYGWTTMRRKTKIQGGGEEAFEEEEVPITSTWGHACGVQKSSLPNRARSFSSILSSSLQETKEIMQKILKPGAGASSMIEREEILFKPANCKEEAYMINLHHLHHQEGDIITWVWALPWQLPSLGEVPRWYRITITLLSLPFS